MTARQPWLRATASTAPAALTLRQTDAGAPARGPWLSTGTSARPQRDPTAADPAGAGCPGCFELGRLRATLDVAHDEATARGRRDGADETAAVRAHLAVAIAAIERVRTARADSLTEQVVDLALGLCAELAPAAAAIDRRGLVQLVARSLADAGGTRELVVQVCSEDAAAIGTQLPAGLVCAVRADLVPGEVWIDAPRLVIDGRWATRLAALREPLLALVRAAEPAFELAPGPVPVTAGGDDDA